MVYTYTPIYYSSFQDTVASICKSMLLPFSLKNRALPADQKLAKKHSELLKWQQESFHKILNLIGLHKEGMVAESEVSAFRAHVLDTLIASPIEQEPVGVIRDKLLFLQELFYAKCISADEYHSSKRPLLQRLAVQGAEIDCKDVIIGNSTVDEPEEQWSVIELRDKDPPPVSAEKSTSSKTRNPIKSLINWKGKDKKKKDKNSAVSNTNSSILMPETPTTTTRKPFSSLKSSTTPESKERSSKKQWGFDGFKKWKKSGNGEEDESATPYLLFSQGRSDETDSVPCTLVASPIGEGPDTKRIKKKIHADGSSSDFFIDKVLGENIKKELSRIKTELSATNPNINLTDDQMEAISTRLPVEKADLNDFFPKSWCDRYGDVVLGVVRKEFKDHVGEMETLGKNGREKSGDDGSERRWVAFEENEENFHPNLFSNVNLSSDGKRKDCFLNNPFWASKN